MTDASEKTVASKLGLKSGEIVRLVGADAELAALLDPLPEGVVVSVSEPADVAVIFVVDEADLRERLFTELTALPSARSVWIAYRKGNVTDINRDSIRKEAMHVGWEAVSNVSLGDVWSAVRIKPAG
ncbi:MAG: hypothetical protein JWR36_1588 [Glaciihabitans sp.]|nr:hypothetical protein [Glaciihabitans sp.]